MSHPSLHVSVVPWGGLPVVLISFSAGFLAGNAVGLGFSALLSGIVGAIVTYGSYGRGATNALIRSLFFAVYFFVLGLLVVITTGVPWLAAIAIAVVAFVGSLLTTDSPLGLTAALLSSTGYLILAGFSSIFVKDQAQSTLALILAISIGIVSGIVLTVLSSFVLARLPQRHASLAEQRIALRSLWTSALESTRTFRRAPRDGIRRAIALGIAMFIFQSNPTHDGFLLLITTAIVLPVYGRVALITVGSRLLGSFMAIGIALILPFVLPRPVVSVIAILVLVYAITTALRSTTNSLTAACISLLLLIGAPGAEIGMYAGWRLIDAAGGFVIAWLCGYVLWPQQPLMITPIPPDLHRQCESVRPVLTAQT